MMDPEEFKELKPGTVVLVRWPGAADGTDAKRVRVVRVSRDGKKVAAQVARTTPKGEYTGGFGTSLRWFWYTDAVEVVEAPHA